MPTQFLRLMKLLWLVTLVTVLSLVSTARSAPPTTPSTGCPRLAVLIYFDQLRGDYLIRWNELFGEGGFHRLEQEGAWFQNCHYPYALTVTGAGHASVATGTSPNRHGIIGNDWYERKSGASVNCVSSDRYEQVPLRSPGKTSSRKGGNISPERLLAPTLADALKEATHGKGRVVSLSFKDRGAVLAAGKSPDACYWLDSASGQFVTSTYYRDRLHPWVEDYNKGHPSDRWLGKEWTRLRSDLDYEKYSGPDDVDGEAKGVNQGRTFPHPLDKGPVKLMSAYYGALYTSPFGNEVLLGLVKQAIDEEKLGTRDVPDLLCVSFSCNDPIGHSWGPDSQEVLDVTLRSDLLVKDLLMYLDAKVGQDRYVLVLTSDHGICPLPELSRKHGRASGRVPPSLLKARADAFLNGKYGLPGAHDYWVEATSGPWVYLNQALIGQKGVKAEDVEKALAAWLTQQDGIQAVYTRSQLTQTPPINDVLTSSVRQSFHPDRAGDLFVLTKPYYFLSSQLTGTTHGTPHDYDTHVPLLVVGPGIVAGKRKEAVTPQAAPAILAHALDIKPPAAAEYPVPAGLFPSPVH